MLRNVRQSFKAHEPTKQLKQRHIEARMYSCAMPAGPQNSFSFYAYVSLWLTLYSQTAGGPKREIPYIKGYHNPSVYRVPNLGDLLFGNLPALWIVDDV